MTTSAFNQNAAANQDKYRLRSGYYERPRAVVAGNFVGRRVGKQGGQEDCWRSGGDISRGCVAVARAIVES